ncbi:unnamed protein product [Spirodela intermedia]|uniref:Uncharacterized protein n=1 Tax=Spirodela intermedia TaxID=51605 RepID=A0A7I8JR57_SPIIN|nr:unnamed protein product [Spirodela intermedia]CAA6672063.1 unnamed protein product [Spirodela intermedia]
MEAVQGKEREDFASRVKNVVLRVLVFTFWVFFLLLVKVLLY